MLVKTLPPKAACLGEDTKLRNWYVDSPPSCAKTDDDVIMINKKVRIVFNMAAK